MRRVRDDKGAAAILMVLISTALLAVTTLAVDVGSWYRADRQLQSKVDAAALAGVQELPYDPGKASSVALDYASKNGGGAIPSVSVSGANDTINVVGEDTAPGIFSKLLGIDSVTVHAEASAKVSGIGKAKYVAPLTVSDQHPMLQCARTKPPASCYGPTTIFEDKLSTVPGAFGLISLDTSNPGSSTVADWIQNGYSGALSANQWYDSAPGAKFNSTEIQGAMNSAISKGQDLLFPVYASNPAPYGQGSNGHYYIIGWVVFQPTSMGSQGGHSTVNGIFKGMIWDGLEGSVGQSFGVRIISLTQ